MSQRSEWDFPNAATPPGSAAYYVVRFSEPRQQQALARWFAWFAHIDKIATKASDPGVARLKLDWWREEAGNMIGNQARHPLAQALSEQVHSPIQVEQMQRALQAVEQRILRRQPRTLDEFHHQAADQFASRLQLLCEGHNGYSPTLEKLGTHIGTSHRLAHLATDLRDNYLSLPADLLGQLELSGADIENNRRPEKLESLGDQLFLSVALERSDRKHARTRFQPALRYAAQSRRLQKILKKNRYAANRTHRATPIGLLWSAWRMR